MSIYKLSWSSGASQVATLKVRRGASGALNNIRGLEHLEKSSSEVVAPLRVLPEELYTYRRISRDSCPLVHDL